MSHPRFFVRTLRLAAVVASTLVWASSSVRADLFLFKAMLTGSQETIPSGSAGTGTGTILLDTVAGTITANESWTNLGGPATVSHIHEPAPLGMNAPVVFPFTGVPSAATGAIPQQVFAINPTQIAALQAGLFYFNVHTTAFPGGEIRGQVFAVPEPSPLILAGALAALGLGGRLAARRINRPGRV